jgi:hypothetical protein
VWFTFMIPWNPPYSLYKVSKWYKQDARSWSGQTGIRGSVSLAKVCFSSTTTWFTLLLPKPPLYSRVASQKHKKQCVLSLFCQWNYPFHSKPCQWTLQLFRNTLRSLYIKLCFRVSDLAFVSSKYPFSSEGPCSLFYCKWLSSTVTLLPQQLNLAPSSHIRPLDLKSFFHWSLNKILKWDS